MNRRGFLAAGAVVMFGRSAAAQAEPDPFGLRAIVGNSRYVGYAEAALSRYSQRSILKPSDTVLRATFRLTRIRYDTPWVAVADWDGVTAGAHIQQWRNRAEDVQRMPGSPTYDIRTDTNEGLLLRNLLEDRERFWEAQAFVPVGGERVEPGELTLVACEVVYLMEARVGDRRHAILRPCPAAGGYLAEASKALLD